MEKKSNEVEVFHQFAEDRLKNHFEELKTRYQNEKLASAELKQQAYKEHQEIFSKELDEKIQSLNKENNAWLKGELENLKHVYITKLDLNYT